MPLIRIQSLPFEPPSDMPTVLARISQAFTDKTDISLQYISAIWTFLPAGQYVVAGKIASQHVSSHPILVDILVPDFHSKARAAIIVQAAAASIAQHAKLPLEEVFVNLRLAHSGYVFDQGALVEW